MNKIKENLNDHSNKYFSAVSFEAIISLQGKSGACLLS